MTSYEVSMKMSQENIFNFTSSLVGKVTNDMYFKLFTYIDLHPEEDR